MTAPAPRKEHQTSAAASGIAIVGAVVTTVASFFIAFLVSQGDQELAGLFFVTTATATILGNSCALGTPTGLIYFMPDRLREGGGGPRGLLLIALRPVLVIAGLAGLLLFILAPWLGELTVQDRPDEAATVLRIFAFAVPAWALTNGILGACRSLGSMTPTVLVGQVLRPAGQILLIGLVFLDTSPPSWQIAAAWAIPVGLGLVASVVSLFRLGGLHQSPVTVDDATTSAMFWGYTRARAVANSLQIALERIDVILVGAILGTAEAAVYGALTRFISAGNFLIFSVAQAVSTNMRQAIAHERMQEAGQLLKQASTWLVLIAWPYFLLLAFKPEPLANLLSADYVEDAWILSILAVGMMVSAGAGPIDLTLTMLGRSSESLWGVVLAIVTDVVLLFLLAPTFGLTGAAIAWAVSVVAQNLFASYLVRKHGGIDIRSKASFIAAAAAFLAIIPISLVTSQSFVSLMITAGVAGVVLLGTLAAFRETFGINDLLNRSRSSS